MRAVMGCTSSYAVPDPTADNPGVTCKGTEQSLWHELRDLLLWDAGVTILVCQPYKGKEGIALNREQTENLENAAIIAANILLAQPRPRVISPALLEVLARALKCEWATFWKVNDVHYVLEPAAIWKEASVITGKLERDTLHRTLSMSEGTAGHVWRNQKPIWTTNLARDMCIPRSLDAEHAGLQGGIWFAVKSNTAMYGVIELLSHNLDPANKDVLIAIEHLGMVLGQLIEN